METLSTVWAAGDAVTRGVAVLLLLMSVCTWVLIAWKSWVLLRVRRDVPVLIEQVWSSPDLSVARARVHEADREAALLPLIDTALAPVVADSLGSRTTRSALLTRRLRDGLHDILTGLQSGQVVLASIGSVAPFVGLLGTVWGIYHAMIALASEGSASIEKVSGPVGEALIMTAVGLAVAIPAVLAFNLFGRLVSGIEADLEGFAHDLREALVGGVVPDDLDTRS